MPVTVKLYFFGYMFLILTINNLAYKLVLNLEFYLLHTPIHMSNNQELTYITLNMGFYPLFHLYSINFGTAKYLSSAPTSAKKLCLLNPHSSTNFYLPRTMSDT